MPHPIPFRHPRLGIILAVGVIAIIFAACGGAENSNPPSASQPVAPQPSPAESLAPEPDPPAPSPASDSGAVTTVRTSRLTDATTWLYQLQGRDGQDLDLTALSAHGADLLVVDFSRDGSDAGAFTADELAAAQADGAIVIAYLSIGEAESYRDYWSDAWVQDGQLTDDAPAWLGPFNPDFPDNHKVRYWLPEWQDLILGPSGLLRRIADAGFDGVYLDIIDAFEFWEELPSAGPPPQGLQMSEFIQRIAQVARVELARPDFLIVPQNGAGILATLTDDEQRALLRAVDAIGVEDTFFFGSDDENNPLDPQTEAIADIQRFRAAGLPVFAVDYLTDPDLQSDFYDRARSAGFVPLVTVRELDRVIDQPLSE